MSVAFTDEQLSWARSMDGRSSTQFSSLLLKAYKYPFFKKISYSLALRLEGGAFFSNTVRRILLDYHDVRVGPYSYGSCLVPDLLPRGTIVGAYCSFADGLKVFRRNHALHTLSQHPFFYNKFVGLVPDDTIDSNESNPLVVGNDVWIGDSVLILPGCHFIGDGAVIGAGSVVTKNIEPYAVVAGNPARMIKYRYPSDIATMLQQSKWWELPLPELLSAGSLLTSPINQKTLDEYLNSHKSIEA